MIPPAFDYTVPKSLDEAVALLAGNPEAKLLAGGHSLIPMMKLRLAAPPLLIDLNRLDGLAYIREDGGWLRIGAMTREVELERSALIRDKYPLLADTTATVYLTADFFTYDLLNARWHQIGNIPQMLESIRALEVPEPQRADILGGNAARLLNS